MSLDSSSITVSISPESQSKGRKLGLSSLTAVVIASMIGSGAFNLPQNTSRGAALAAVIIAWMITIAGMFFLANTFRLLADHRPDLKAGIYSYAREGFGSLVGFKMAWGYWLAAALGNVAMVVLSIKVLGYFFPIFANNGGGSLMVRGSALIWFFHFIMLAEVKRVAVLNVIANATNLAVLSLVLGILVTRVQWSNFSLNFWGDGPLGSLLTQVKSTMLVTLWVFLGIESAVVVSNRAANHKQVGTATVIGLAVCTVLYFLLSVLPFGLLPQAELAQLPAPSLAYLLQALVGHWSIVLVIVALLISLGSCWLAWMILLAELPYEGAKGGVFPKFLAQQNRFQAPASSLWVSSIIMQVGLFVVWFAKDAWIWLISMEGVMILPTYLASAAYLWRCVLQAKRAGDNSVTQLGYAALLTGVLGTAYAIWLLIAAGPQFLLMSTILYALGLPVYWWAKYEHARSQPLFSRREAGAVVILVTLALTAIALFTAGIVKIN